MAQASSWANTIELFSIYGVDFAKERTADAQFALGEVASFALRRATRPARSQTAAGRMRRRRKHEEPQMTMEREREPLAQVDQP